MKKRVKMVDVARAANVSRTAVSLILNQVPGVRVAEATRQRVLQVARELGYSPGPILADIDPDRRRIFGVLINEISSAYPIDLLYGLQNWADTNGFQLLVQAADGAPDREAAALSTFRSLGIANIVYASTFSAVVHPPDMLADFRHVLLNCHRDDGKGYAILPDERYGGTLATQHLIDRGRNRIATVTGDPWQFATLERLAGYYQALKEAGLDLGNDYQIASDWSHAGGYAAAQQLLALPKAPDAIFCHNDLIARGAMAALRDAGLDCPYDIAIVGYDDREFAKDFGITTISLPFAEMAERALQQLAESGDLPDQTHAIAGDLIPRSSTGAAKD